MKYSFFTRVADVFHNQPVARVDKGKDGGDPVTHYADDGWYVTLECDGGKNISISIGNEKPVMEKGDRIRLTIEKVQADG